MLNNFIPPPPKAGQEDYVDSIKNNDITICVGKAGTGKTFIALTRAISMLERAKRGGIQRIVIIKPYIPSITGEKIGALPGSLEEKVLPYVEAIKDNLRIVINNEADLHSLIEKKFDFTTLSLCRGRSFNNCFVIVEEAQNVPLEGGAMKMILTRLGKDSKMVIQGDLDQMDIASVRSALPQAMNVLQDVDGVGIVEMNTMAHIHRSPMVAKVLKAYEEYEKWQSE